jgi:hypothetical protein
MKALMCVVVYVCVCVDVPRVDVLHQIIQPGGD